jgi:hypothetical protein
MGDPMLGLGTIKEQPYSDRGKALSLKKLSELTLNDQQEGASRDDEKRKLQPVHLQSKTTFEALWSVACAQNQN